MRISDAAPLLLAAMLAGCSSASDGANGFAAAEAQANADAADDGMVDCAPQGSAAFTRQCLIERAESNRGLVLTIRRPDGGFHRLLVTKDGRGVVAADGAEPARVTIVGKDQIEVAIGGDRYRLPATVKGRK